MQPGFDLRLRAMMRAMQEVVLPAVDSDNKLAVEQANIVLGSLALIREQVDYAHWFEAADLISLADMARQLAEIAGLDTPAKLNEDADKARDLAQRWDTALSTLREANYQLREAISETVELAFAADDPAVTKSVQNLIMASGEQQIGRERAYVAKMGWDIYPESLQGIEESLAAVKIAS